MSDAGWVIVSYVVLFVLAGAGWPWFLLGFRPNAENGAWASDRRPRDLSFPLAKSAGLILVSYLTWLLGFAGVPATTATVWIIAAAVGFAGWVLVLARRSWEQLGELWRGHRWAILTSEAVFLVVFLAFCRIRALTPDATFRFDETRRDYDDSASEKFTNLALLNSLWRERTMPPRDTWLAGHPINYYYFGHYQWATFCKMAGMAPRVGFNVGQAALFAMIAANAFSLGLLLTRRAGAGVLASAAVVLTGNPYGCLQLPLQGLKHFQFWQASRIVEGTFTNGQITGPITEFPFFTFILGDFHAHGISFHSFLLALALALIIGRRLFCFGRPTADEADAAPAFSAGIFPWAVAVLPLGLLLAVTAMTNAWDAPMLGLVMFAVLLVCAFERGRASWRAVVGPIGLSAAIGGAAVVFLSPFLATFQFPVGARRDPAAFYLGPLKWLGASHLSEFKDYLMHFGFFLIPATLFLLAQMRGHIRQGPEPSQARGRTALAFGFLVALYVFLFAHRFFLLFFLAALLLLAAVLIGWEMRRSRSSAAEGDASGARIIAYTLTAVGLFLSLFVEVWVVDDGYEGLFERYNTVFKSYNVIWILYAVSFAVLMAEWLAVAKVDGVSALARRRAAIKWAMLGAVLLAGLVYPCAATLARVRATRQRAQMRERVALPRGPALDAVRYFASFNREEYALIEWIEDRLRGKPVVAEGCRATDAYSVQGRIATLTGVRTVLAWPQHEANWRSRVRSSFDPTQTVDIWAEMGQRIADLQQLYTTRDIAAIKVIVKRYAIEYIVIGRWERALYGPEAGRRLRDLYPAYFSNGTTVLLRTDMQPGRRK
ncbi:MAG: DUF2298 domain-containing protein [Candidatus Sumerlaeia bacterium]|nr:DUF2298 domain-containing protein [Candidatus Sumerlaeia bacterium]